MTEENNVYQNPPLEAKPSVEQRQRLEDFLIDLRWACNQHQIALDSEGGELVVVDMIAESIIGVGLTAIVERVDHLSQVTSLDSSGSVLDGAWLVDGPDGGLVEQRELPSFQREQKNRHASNRTGYDTERKTP